jgi:hypothetical protein
MITNSFFKGKNLSVPLGDENIQSRFKNKFENGFLSGVGSGSQFTQLTTLPIAPANSNYDLDKRIISSLGIENSGTTLLPSWQQSKAWNVGLGQDALLSGITRTLSGAGQEYAVTGLYGPNVNAGLDYINRAPITPFNASAQNGISFSGGNTPVALFGSDNVQGWTNQKQTDAKKQQRKMKQN